MGERERVRRACKDSFAVYGRLPRRGRKPRRVPHTNVHMSVQHAYVQVLPEHGFVLRA